MRTDVLVRHSVRRTVRREFAGCSPRNSLSANELRQKRTNEQDYAQTPPTPPQGGAVLESTRAWGGTCVRETCSFVRFSCFMFQSNRSSFATSETDQRAIEGQTCCKLRVLPMNLFPKGTREPLRGILIFLSCKMTFPEVVTAMAVRSYAVRRPRKSCMSLHIAPKFHHNILAHKVLVNCTIVVFQAVFRPVFDRFLCNSFLANVLREHAVAPRLSRPRQTPCNPLWRPFP